MLYSVQLSLLEDKILPTTIIFGGLAMNLLVVVVLSSKSFETKPLKPSSFMKILAINNLLILDFDSNL